MKNRIRMGRPESSPIGPAGYQHHRGRIRNNITIRGPCVMAPPLPTTRQVQCQIVICDFPESPWRTTGVPTRARRMPRRGGFFPDRVPAIRVLRLNNGGADPGTAFAG